MKLRLRLHINGFRDSPYQQKAQNFKRTLVFDNGLFPLGLMCFALDYALNEKTKIGGVFEGVRTGLRFEGSRKLLATASAMNDFRNKYVAHQEEELNDGKLARAELQGWIEGLRAIHEAVRISAT